MRTASLLASASVMFGLGVALAAPATAQSAAALGTPQPAADNDVPPAAPLPSQDVASDAAAPAVDDGTGADVVVTAQRRSEILRDVPATVTALSPLKLEQANITNSLQLTQVTPALQFAQLGAYAQPVLRGIGSQVTASGNSTNVAVYVDGVYQASQFTNNFDFFALQGIEVLKGPQGTLYGRNAAGGAILVTTKAPTYDTVLMGQLTYGSYDEKRINGYASVGLTDTLAANIAVQYNESDGYITNIFPTRHRVGANDTLSLRGKLLFEPTPVASFLLTVDHTDSNNPLGMLSGTFRGNSFARPLGFPVSSGAYEVALSFDPEFSYKTTGVTLKSDIDLGFASLTSYSGWRRTTNDQLIDADYTPVSAPAQGGILVTLNGPQSQYSEEIILNSKSEGPLSWTAGASYNNETDRLIARTNGALSYNAITKTENVSGFAELTYALTDALSITGGARYSSESKNLQSRNDTLFRQTAPVTYNAWTPRAVIKYKLGEDTNLYASYNRGFKSGGFNPAGPTTVVIPFRPEKIDAFEVGLKTSAIRRLSFELAGYYYDYSDIQFQKANPNPAPGVPLVSITNAAKSEIYGVEFNSNWRPLPGFTLQAGGAWTHARYQSFPGALLTTPRPTGGNIQFSGDASGNEMIRVPELSGNVSATYLQSIGYGSLQFSANVYGSSGFYADAANRLRQPAYSVTNANIAWLLPDDHFRLTFWVRNAFAERYALQLYDPVQSDRQIIAPPRTFGVTGDVKF